jgi:hypothetical protein
MANVVPPFSQEQLREMEERATERAIREVRDWARTGLLDEIVARIAKGKGKGQDEGPIGDGKGKGQGKGQEAPVAKAAGPKGRGHGWGQGWNAGWQGDRGWQGRW